MALAEHSTSAWPSAPAGMAALANGQFVAMYGRRSPRPCLLTVSQLHKIADEIAQCASLHRVDSY
jgi:hypothetical protein